MIWKFLTMLFGGLVLSAAASSLGAQGAITLATNTTAGNGNAGIIFEITVTNPVVLHTFGTTFSTTTANHPVNFWHRPGGMGANPPASPASTAGWVMAGSGTVSPTNTTSHFEVNAALNLTLMPGVHGFAIHSGSVRYQDPPTGPFADANISLNVNGYGLNNNTAVTPPWSSYNVGRGFTGFVRYDLAGPSLGVSATAGTVASVFANADGGGDGVRGGGSFTITDNDHANISQISLTEIEITASGGGDDVNAFDEVAIYRDSNNNDVYDPGTDVLIDSVTGGFPTDNGLLTFNLPTGEQDGWGGNQARRYLVVAKFAGVALPNDDFMFAVTGMTVIGHAQAQAQGFPTSALSGFEIATPSFVFTDASPTPAPEAFVTQSGVCNVFTIGYPAGPDDKPASITLNSQGSADEAADLDDVDLYWDFDNDGAFVAANDTLINTQVFTSNNGDLVFDLSTLPDFTAGDTRRFFVVYNFNASASDLETVQCSVFSMGPAPLGGTASGLPLGFSAGLVIRAAILFGSMTGPGAAVTVDSNAQDVLIANVLLDTLPGGVGSWIIPILTFNAGGTGNHNTAYTQLALYEDTNASNAWDAGDQLAAPELPGFSANMADFDLIQPNLAPGTDRRFFLVGNMSGLAATGETFGARLTSLTVTQRPNGGQELGFPTAASTALIIDVAALSVSNSPEQPMPATHASGAAGELVAAAFRLNALNGATTVNGITFTTSGTGDWTSDVNATTGVAVYRDNGDGVYSPTDDAFLTETGGASPIVTTSFNLPLTTGEIADLWVAIRLTATAGQGIAATPETFIVSINDPSTDVSATNPATTGMPAPAGVAVGAIEFNVTNFDPATAQQSGTQPITITGSGFMMPFTVVIGGTACPGTPVIAGGTQVTGLTVPPGVGINMPIIIHSGTLPPQTLTQTFTYIAPKDNDPPKSDDGGSCSGDTGARWPLAALFAGALLMGVAMMLRRRSA